MHPIEVLLCSDDALVQFGRRVALEDSMAGIGSSHGAEECPRRRPLCAQPLYRSGRLDVKLVVGDYNHFHALHDYVPQAAWTVEIVDRPGNVRGGVSVFTGKGVKILEGEVLGHQGDMVGVFDGQIGVRVIVIA